MKEVRGMEEEKEMKQEEMGGGGTIGGEREVIEKVVAKERTETLRRDAQG